MEEMRKRTGANNNLAVWILNREIHGGPQPFAVDFDSGRVELLEVHEFGFGPPDDGAGLPGTALWSCERISR